MKKSVLVIDNLTETFDGSVVRSGLQKSSKLDARAFSKLGYQTTYMYCGRVVDPGYEYMHYGVNSLGAKDQAMKEGKNPSRQAVILLLLVSLLTTGFAKSGSSTLVSGACHVKSG